MTDAGARCGSADIHSFTVRTAGTKAHHCTPTAGGHCCSHVAFGESVSTVASTARSSADDDLRAMPHVFDIAAGTNRRLKTNLAWAFLYNAVAIPLAVVGPLNPLFAATAMAASSLLVVANSARRIPGAPIAVDATDAIPCTGQRDTDDAHPPNLAGEASDD